MTGAHLSCIDLYIKRRHFLLNVFYKYYHMYLSILCRWLSKSLYKSVTPGRFKLYKHLWLLIGDNEPKLLFSQTFPTNTSVFSDILIDNQQLKCTWWPCMCLCNQIIFVKENKNIKIYEFVMIIHGENFRQQGQELVEISLRHTNRFT